MKKSIIEDLYDNLQENIITEIENTDDITNIFNEMGEIDLKLKNILGKEKYKIFDEYLYKQADLLDLERKKAFSYGYKLSNKLIIDALRE